MHWITCLIFWRYNNCNNNNNNASCSHDDVRISSYCNMYDSFVELVIWCLYYEIGYLILINNTNIIALL